MERRYHWEQTKGPLTEARGPEWERASVFSDQPRIDTGEAGTEERGAGG